MILLCYLPPFSLLLVWMTFSLSVFFFHIPFIIILHMSSYFFIFFCFSISSPFSFVAGLFFFAPLSFSFEFHIFNHFPSHILKHFPYLYHIPSHFHSLFPYCPWFHFLPFSFVFFPNVLPLFLSLSFSFVTPLFIFASISFPFSVVHSLVLLRDFLFVFFRYSLFSLFLAVRIPFTTCRHVVVLSFLRPSHTRTLDPFTSMTRQNGF